MVVTGSALERGCVGKLPGTRSDHVRDGVANRDPESPQVEEGNHPSSLLRVVRKDPVGMSLRRRRSPKRQQKEQERTRERKSRGPMGRPVAGVGRPVAAVGGP